MKKRILSLTLALCVMGGNVLGSAGTLVVQAEEYEVVAAAADGAEYTKNYSYTIRDDGTLEITGYKEIEGITELVIPNTMDGKKVTSIGDEAFANCKSLTNVEIPSSVTSIGAFAFYSCKNLISIEIPDSVTSIGHLAFSSCQSLISIEIPDSVTNIGTGAFEETPWLEAKRQEDPFVVINGILIDGRTVIGNVKIPMGVTSIGDDAFHDCQSLISIEIPGSVTSIGNDAFNSCQSLISIEIPGSVTSIGNRVFNGCQSLTSIEIADSVTNIGVWAFEGTPWLEAKRQGDPFVVINGILIDGRTVAGNVKIPMGVTSIGDNAFDSCQSLTSIKIADSVTNIGDSAFCDCENLISIEIADSVTNIGNSAFYNCKNLISIEILGSLTNIGGLAFEGTPWLEAKRQKNPFVVINSILIDGRTVAGNAKIPMGVTSIGDDAFNGCKSLTSIEIPDSVTSIGDDAFNGCKSLTSIEIPDSVTSIGNQAFWSCTALKDVYYGGSEAQWNLIDIGQDNDALVSAAMHYPGISDNSDADNKHEENKTTALKKVAVSKTSVIYAGKEQKPAVIVTDINGKMVNKANYTVIYTNNKKVGQATVTVTGKGNYTGTIKAAFKILPKGTTLSKVTAKKKAIAVKWKKQTKEVSGYQIQYSTSKKFKGEKIITIKKNKTTSATIKRLKARKKYYVRVRTYKKVKINGKSTNLYSKWSKAKDVKTKK